MLHSYSTGWWGCGFTCLPSRTCPASRGLRSVPRGLGCFPALRALPPRPSGRPHWHSWPLPPPAHLSLGPLITSRALQVDVPFIQAHNYYHLHTSACLKYCITRHSRTNTIVEFHNAAHRNCNCLSVFALYVSQTANDSLQVTILLKCSRHQSRKCPQPQIASFIIDSTRKSGQTEQIHHHFATNGETLQSMGAPNPPPQHKCVLPTGTQHMVFLGPRGASSHSEAAS